MRPNGKTGNGDVPGTAVLLPTNEAGRVGCVAARRAQRGRSAEALAAAARKTPPPRSAIRCCGRTGGRMDNLQGPVASGAAWHRDEGLRWADLIDAVAMALDRHPLPTGRDAP